MVLVSQPTHPNPNPNPNPKATDGARQPANTPHVLRRRRQTSQMQCVPGRVHLRTVLVFDQGFALEDAIEFHAFAPLEALPCV